MDKMNKGLIDASAEEARLSRMEGLLHGMQEGTLVGLTVGRGREGVEVGQFEEDLPVLMITTFASEDRKGGSMLCSTIDSIGRLSADPVKSIALLSVVYILGSFPTTSSCL